MTVTMTSSDLDERLEQEMRCVHLVHAMIQNVIEDLREEAQGLVGTTDRKQQRRRYREIAMRYIMSDSQEPFSYLWSCAVLEIDEKQIRTAALTGRIKDWVKNNFDIFELKRES